MHASSSTASPGESLRWGSAPWRAGMVLAGLALLFVPTYVDLYRVFWSLQRGAQGPIILAIIAWLVWRQRAALREATDAPAAPGVALLLAGLLLYVPARSQSIYLLEVIAQIPILLGVVWLTMGREGMRRLWFPIALIVFLAPIPGSLLDQVLLPLKGWVSATVDNTLHLFGYPIARDGVVLTIGAYSLLIADACSGLNSMVALSGIGLLYVHLAGHTSRAHNVALLLSILPIAFLANIIRVTLLVLITYYRGESSGKAFHDHAGVLEVALAFGGFFLFDHLLMLLNRALRAPPPLVPARHTP
jgi:exosortase B